MFNQIKGISGIKIAVIAIEILNVFQFIFSNYSSEEARNVKYGQSL